MRILINIERKDCWVKERIYERLKSLNLYILVKFMKREKVMVVGKVIFNCADLGI